MFDLVDILKKGENQKVEKQQEITSVLFYQTEKCHSLVKEAYRFEGLVPPALLVNSDENIREHVRNEQIEIVIIELNESSDISRDAERISHLLPNDASVIVIGSEDAISTIRNLKQMGFYYLFWPITKHELIEFVLSVHDNRHSNRGLGKKRKAKQISIIGCKGGVGTTFICSEVAYLLSEKKNSSCVVVDNDYMGGNLDIMLGMEKFEKRQIRAGAFATTLDPTSAQSMLNKSSKLLSVLSLAPSAGMGNTDIKEYTKTVASQVSENVNFLIEDLSSISQQCFDHKELAELSDCMILVLTPTVSALREAARIKQRMVEDKDSLSCRLYMVMNCIVPDAAATVTQEEVEKYLHQPVDVVIPYIKKLDAMVLDGKRICMSGGKPEKALYRLVSLIVGEEEKKGFHLFSR
ncbi:type II secretion system protein Z [Vibrio albus]|uniref:Type II secretion system protein Z n=1 Tax=Vibrio albus TaxID=2200953 RepID=A0A2U3BEK8_9VIBR|nr:P-loop NTPase [Vibrio albus]PWI35236.1 type II secretion system protein Z [Vibrio albus]